MNIISLKHEPRGIYSFTSGVLLSCNAIMIAMLSTVAFLSSFLREAFIFSVSSSSSNHGAEIDVDGVKCRIVDESAIAGVVHC